jgi:hypothetical protein
MIRELPDPMADYRELLKKNREAGAAKKPAAAPAGVDPAALEEARRRGLIK